MGPLGAVSSEDATGLRRGTRAPTASGFAGCVVEGWGHAGAVWPSELPVGPATEDDMVGAVDEPVESALGQHGIGNEVGTSPREVDCWSPPGSVRRRDREGRHSS